MLNGFIIYFAIFLLFAFIGLYRTKNNVDFWLARRSSGPFVAAFAAGASDMSSWLFLALPGAAYIYGFQKIFLCLGLILGAFYSWTYVAPIFYDLSKYYSRLSTFPQFLCAYYTKPSDMLLRRMMSLLMIVFFTIYLAAGLIAMTQLVEKLLPFSTDYTRSEIMIAMTGFVFVVSALGGAVALRLIELFQGVSLFLVLIGLSCFNFSSTLLNDIGFEYQSWDWLAIMQDLSWGLGYLGVPHFILRFTMIARKNTISTARNIACLWMIGALFGAFFLGWAGLYYYPNLVYPDMVFTCYLRILPPWLEGYVFALMLGSSLGSILAQLLAVVSALSQDIFYRNKPSVFIDKVCFMFVLGGALSAALWAEQGIMEFVYMAWSGLAMTFAPLVTLMILSRKVSREVLLGSLILSSILLVVVHYFQMSCGLLWGYMIILSYLRFYSVPFRMRAPRTFKYRHAKRHHNPGLVQAKS